MKLWGRGGVEEGQSKDSCNKNVAEERGTEEFALRTAVK